MHTAGKAPTMTNMQLWSNAERRQIIYNDAKVENRFPEITRPSPERYASAVAKSGVKNV